MKNDKSVESFKPGDRVEFCGIEAVVVANYGSTGIVDVPGEGRMTWRWVVQDTAVTLAEGRR